MSCCSPCRRTISRSCWASTWRALGIFTVALLFSLTHVLILRYLGEPDFGIIASTYLGYWLMGVMMIAIGLVASLLSSNATVAFILGAVFCAVPVWLWTVGAAFGGGVRRFLVDMAIPSQFHDFGTGVIPASGVLYFLTLAGAMLYLNMILIGRRHWAGGERSRGLAAHSLVRVLAVVAVLVGFDVLVTKLGKRHDNSAEKLYTLSAASEALIKQIPADRPVYIQAYYSPEVPPRVRRGQGQPARPAPRIRRARGRPGPAQPGRDRAVLDRREGCAEAVRDRAQEGHEHRARPPVNGRRLPGRGVHLGDRRGRGAVLRTPACRPSTS